MFFLVGGAVRDGLLGLPVHDNDFVVVGSTSAAMEAQGFRPVGKDFPVFLHPVTSDEYALARTERKSGHGYKGFTVYAGEDVTLEADLGRRDLTINAMAQSSTGQLIDPHGGKSDLEAGILRHVSAQSFVEDPVRVLRLARFATRYQNFEVSPETMTLANSMVQTGELNHLVAERVWQELAKGLMEDNPARMFEVLRDCGALQVLMPELNNLWGVPQHKNSHPEIDTGEHVMLTLTQAAQQGLPLNVRFACLLHDLGKGVTPSDILPAHHNHEKLGVPLVKAVCDRLKVPSACSDLALMVCREHLIVHRAQDMRPSSIVRMMERTDALRRPERFALLLEACECDAKGRLGLQDVPYPQKEYLLRALDLVREVDAGAVVAKCTNPAFIAERIHEARVFSLHCLVEETDDNEPRLEQQRG